MATPDDSWTTFSCPAAGCACDLLTDRRRTALHESLRLARETRWDSVRSPHVFMGLLAAPDAGVRNWGERLGADLPKLLGQFQELFHQEEGERGGRAGPQPRVPLRQRHPPAARSATTAPPTTAASSITPMDLLISLLTAPNSIVAECFERIGVTAAKLTELAVIAEQHAEPADAGATNLPTDPISPPSVRTGAVCAPLAGIEPCPTGYNRTGAESEPERGKP